MLLVLFMSLCVLVLRAFPRGGIAGPRQPESNFSRGRVGGYLIRQDASRAAVGVLLA